MNKLLTASFHNYRYILSTYSVIGRWLPKLLEMAKLYTLFARTGDRALMRFTQEARERLVMRLNESDWNTSSVFHRS